jgi:formylglycine-generating enzyme required for sulfatase activity
MASDRMSVAGPAAAPARSATFVDTAPADPNARTLALAPSAAEGVVASTAEAATATSSTTGARGAAAKSKTPLVAGLFIGALVLAGGAAFALRGGSSDGGKAPAGLGSAAAKAATSNVLVASPAASASATASSSGALAASCPAGMVAVPGGEYFMGSEEKDALDTEKPPHRVKLSPYCLDVHEVTVAEYKECSDQGKCRRAGKENVWPGITDPTGASIRGEMIPRTPRSSTRAGRSASPGRGSIPTRRPSRR